MQDTADAADVVIDADSSDGEPSGSAPDTPTAAAASAGELATDAAGHKKVKATVTMKTAIEAADDNTAAAAAAEAWRQEVRGILHCHHCPYKRAVSGCAARQVSQRSHVKLCHMQAGAADTAAAKPATEDDVAVTMEEGQHVKQVRMQRSACSAGCQPRACGSVDQIPMSS